MSHLLRTKLRVLALTAGAFTGGVLVASGLDWTAGSHATTLAQVAPSGSEVRPVAELSEAFIAISEAVTPAVVAIETERAARRGERTGGIPDEIREMYPWFRLPDDGSGEGVRRPPQQGSGSGFIITADGHILTNNHVVEGADKITVVLSDNRHLTATVVGRDPTTDVAVIKVAATGLPIVRIGSSESTRIGEWVLAIGNPLDLGTTVTSGIVSAKGRPLAGIIGRNAGEQRAWAIEDFIQTDAPINPGNSGGPLVNLRGEVVGVNSAIASPTGFYSGYGFAVPIDLARKVADDLIRHGRVRRPALGITLQDVSPEDAEVFKLERIAGVVVQDYAPTGPSPARDAGIRQGDVIVAVDGRPVERTGQLQRIIATRRPGDEVRLGIVRYGDSREVRVRLGEAPAPPQPVAARAQARDEADASTSRLGVQVQPLTPQLAQEYRLRTTSGVVITNVDPAGPAYRQGVPRGVRVISVDGEAVGDVAAFRRLLARKRSGEVVSLVLEYAQGQQGIENIRLP